MRSSLKGLARGAGVPDPISTVRPWYETHPAYRWTRAAVMLALLAGIDWEVYAGWVRGEYTIKPAIIFWWLLLPFHLAVLWGAFPDALYPGDYPPPEPAVSRRWTVAAPGVPYGCVCPAAMLAIGAVATTAAVLSADGRPWTLGGVLGMVLAGSGAAVGLGFLLRTRPQLDVDEEQREMVWRPGTILGNPLTLPFAAVAEVGVASDVPEGHHPVIRWHSNKGRVVETRLPAGAPLEGVEALVARLRAALNRPAPDVAPPR